MTPQLQNGGIPDGKPAVDLPEGCKPAGEQRAPMKRVLIADDNRDWADSLAAFLEDAGFSVRACYDGREALEAAAIFHPNVVLLDIRMPNLSGYEAARVFRRHPEKTRPVLIAVTAWPNDDGRSQAERTGFDHYVEKSPDPGDLVDLLQRL